MLNWIARAYNWATGKIDTTVASWVNTIVRGIWSFLASIFGVVTDAWNLYWAAAKAMSSAVDSFFGEVYHWTVWWLKVYWHQWLQWLNTHVVAPLTTAYNWVVHEGATIWHYISNPADLVALIWSPLVTHLEAEAWTVGELLGKFFLSLVIKNLTRFVSLLEDIIDAVF
jgi:hypothetical protein